MKIIKRILKCIGILLLLPVIYMLTALLLGSIPVNTNQDETFQTQTMYLNSNGVHLDVIIPKASMNSILLKDLKYNTDTNYFAFGWGDENFYLNTPEWSDLTFKNAFNALFLNSSSLVHVERYKHPRTDWVKVKVTEVQLEQLQTYILNTFQPDDNKNKVILKGKGYHSRDDFYKAKGSYSIFKTCNSWVNSALKESAIKACFWTPFDFPLLNKHK